MCVEGRDGHVVVVDVERGVGGIVVDGRAVARFGDRVKVVGKRRARGRRVRTADEALASVVGGHEVEGRLCCRFFRVVGILGQFRSVRAVEGDGPLALSLYILVWE